MVKEELFDWYSFLTKNILRCQIFEMKKNVCMSLWADTEISQGEHFNVHALFANPWDCSVSLDLNLQVTPRTFLGAKKQAGKLLLPRQWQIQLSPAETALVTAKGYACFDCKSCSISFSKAKVSKQGMGNKIYKRRGKPFGASVNPLGLLLLPLGFYVISWNQGVSLMLKVRGDKQKKQDNLENIQPGLVAQSLWSLAEPDKLHLAPLIDAYFKDIDEQTKAAVKSRCVEAFRQWAQQHQYDAPLNVLRAMDLGEAQKRTPLSVC
jgi:hypothetical protein